MFDTQSISKLQARINQDKNMKSSFLESTEKQAKPVLNIKKNFQGKGLGVGMSLRSLTGTSIADHEQKTMILVRNT